MKTPKKGASKRQSLKLQYKIKKKVRQHTRRVRKEANKLKKLGIVKKKLKNEDRIPNSYPYKEKLLEEMERGKKPHIKVIYQEKEIEKQRMDQELSLEQIIEQADIFLEVLDSRNPLACRDSQIEKQINDLGKQIVLVMNKCELVPEGTLHGWLAHLRKEYPTGLFDCLSGEDQSEVEEGLIQVLRDISTSSENVLKIGVIGYSNVGKKSLLKKLKYYKLNNNQDGIFLTENLELINCAGEIECKQNENFRVLNNLITADKVTDYMAAVNEIVGKVIHKKLILHFEIAKFEDAKQFLTNVALRHGIGSKTAPDLEATAKFVITDWLAGKLQYFENPPK